MESHPKAVQVEALVAVIAEKHRLSSIWAATSRAGLLLVNGQVV